MMEYKKKSLSSLDIKKDYEEIDTRLASGWYVDDINTPKKRIYKTKNYYNAPNFHAGIAEILSFRENGKVSGLSAYGKKNEEILSIFKRQISKNKDLFTYSKNRKKRSVPKINSLKLS